jgi:hypothetical protein
MYVTNLILGKRAEELLAKSVALTVGYILMLT